MSRPDVTVTIPGDLRDFIARELGSAAHELSLRIEGRGTNDGNREFWSIVIGRRDGLRELLKQIE